MSHVCIKTRLFSECLVAVSHQAPVLLVLHLKGLLNVDLETNNCFDNASGRADFGNIAVVLYDFIFFWITNS